MQTSRLQVPRPAIDPASDDRAWFLKDSRWEDPVWRFAPTNALEEELPVSLAWDFALQEGRHFTDARYATLRQTCKQLVALIRCRSLCTGLPLRPRSVLNYFFRCDSSCAGWTGRASADLPSSTRQPCCSFSIGSPSCQRRADRRGLRPRCSAICYLFTYLHRFRMELDDGLGFDPFPGSNHRQAAGDREGLRRPWPSTPDGVAVPLVQAAVDIVMRDAGRVLQAMETYRQAMAATAGRSQGGYAHTGRATRRLKRANSALPEVERPLASVAELVLRIDMLYAACFVVLSYLVGPRVSEILHLKAGCVQERHDSGACVDSPVTVIVGSIFKRQPGYDGRPHEWVAPPVAVQATTVLEALSAEHRMVSGRHELWLRRRRGNGATEWFHARADQLEIASPSRVATQLQRFGAETRADPSGSALEADDPPGAQDLRQVCGAARPHLPLRAEPAPGSSRACGDRPRLRRLRLSPQSGDRRRDPAAVRRRLGAHAGGARASAAARASRSSPSALVSGQPHEAGPQELRPPARRRRPGARRVRLVLLRLPRGTQRLPRQRRRAEPSPTRTFDLRALPELRRLAAASAVLARTGAT